MVFLWFSYSYEVLMVFFRDDWRGSFFQDGSKCPPSPISDEVSVDAAPKDKKSGPLEPREILGS